MQMYDALERSKRRWAKNNTMTNRTTRMFSSIHACRSTGWIAVRIQVPVQKAANKAMNRVWFTIIPPSMLADTPHSQQSEFAKTQISGPALWPGPEFSCAGRRCGWSIACAPASQLTNQVTLTSIGFGFAAGTLGRRTFKTPSRNSAAILLASASSGTVKVRSKLPNERSIR